MAVSRLTPGLGVYTDEEFFDPVRGKTGMLVAFRSGVFHQVTPVTRGERFTIVSWFV